jgi:hypothetical protein
MFAGVNSGEQSPGAEVLEPDIQDSVREEEMARGLDGGAGLGEETLAVQLSTILESAELLGFELPAPVRSFKVLDSPTTMLPTIPESVEGLGYETLTPVKRSKRLSDSSEHAGEVGFDGHLPVKQSKQMKVFQRRESPLSKITKS